MALFAFIPIPDFFDSLFSLFAAFVLGTLIGAERQYSISGGVRIRHPYSAPTIDWGRCCTCSGLEMAQRVES